MYSQYVQYSKYIRVRGLILYSSVGGVGLHKHARAGAILFFPREFETVETIARTPFYCNYVLLTVCSVTKYNMLAVNENRSLVCFELPCSAHKISLQHATSFRSLH